VTARNAKRLRETLELELGLGRCAGCGCVVPSDLDVCDYCLAADWAAERAEQDERRLRAAALDLAAAYSIDLAEAQRRINAALAVANTGELKSADQTTERCAA
jgi:hypothetical protein